MDSTIIFTILGIHLLAVISPGPDLIVILKTALQQSKKEALMVSFGIGMGIFVHVFYAVAGLAFVISQSIMLFNLIKGAASIYLAFLAYKSLTASKTERKTLTNKKKATNMTLFQAFSLGFITNVLNPKATLFFLGIFTMVITPETSIVSQFMLGTALAVNTFLWFAFVSFIFTIPRIQKAFYKIEKPINTFFGVILGALSIKMLTSTLKN